MMDFVLSLERGGVMSTGICLDGEALQSRVPVIHMPIFGNNCEGRRKI